MLNSKRFLNAFASIEKYLRERSLNGRRMSFYELVEIVGESDRAVRRFEKDLKEYADLRNAIVHERSDGHVIAEPNDQAVDDIERINSLLQKPPVLIPLFQTQVVIFSTEESLASAVKVMLDESISQVPIYDGKEFAGLLTANTIARWLGSCVDDDLFSLKETQIAQVLRYTEDTDSHIFLGRDSQIFEALESFQVYESRGKKLEAVLITGSGKPAEKILGIMTISDLPKALEAVK
jgi:predicted transcriptional regulator